MKEIGYKKPHVQPMSGRLGTLDEGWLVVWLVLKKVGCLVGWI